MSRNTCRLYTNLLQLQWPDVKDTTVTDSLGEVDANSWWSLLECSAFESDLDDSTDKHSVFVYEHWDFVAICEP